MVYGALLLGAPPVALPLVTTLNVARGRARRSPVQVRAQVGGSGTGLEFKKPEVFAEELRQWGTGSEPIFTVGKSSDGGAKVSVDEEEIIVRCGFQSMLSGQSCDASERITKARRIAQEIELGRLVPPADSSVFKYVDEQEQAKGVKSVDESVEAVRVREQQPQSAVKVSEQAQVAAQAVKALEVKDETGTGSSQPFLTVGLVVGVAMAVTRRMTSLLLRKRRGKQVRTTVPTKDVKPTLVGAGNEERLTKIRDMAKRAELEDESRLSNKNSEPLPVQYAAVTRTQLVKKQKKSGNKGVDVVALAQQLDEVRRAGEGETLFRQKKLSPDSANGSSRVHLQPAASDAQVQKTDPRSGEGDVRGSKRVMPRIITSYEEALEVLAARKLQDRKKLESGSVAKLSDGTTKTEAEDGADKVEDSQTAESLQKTDQVAKGGKAPDYTVWKEDDVFQDILIKARENDMGGKELFHGMSPDAKEILFQGLEKEMGKEAEQIKAWITNRTDAEAKALKQVDEAGKGESPMIPKYVVDKQPQPESKPQRIVVTTGGGGADSKKENSGSSERKPLKPNKKKVWPKEIQRRYDTETDPKTRRLLKEIGKDLDEWISEEKLEADEKLFNQGIEGQQELLRRWHAELKEEARKKGGNSFDVGNKNATRYEKMQDRIQKWTDMFGPNALAHKYQGYKPAKQDTLWWLDLRYVACVMLKNEEQDIAPGLYSMNMALESDKEERMHIVGFEEQKDALNFCRIMVPELDKLGGSTGAGIIPFEPKELLNEAKSGGYGVTVLKKGQVELYAGKPLEEVESRIVEIGRDVYVQEQLRERSIDIKAIMEDLGRDL